ncbi:MAG: hypothetical protein DWI58_00075 [Chloroflexi bacterium]|nr:MAG: hypothetical protein DWI58_00075 [Chloroflexota bacterium]
MNDATIRALVVGFGSGAVCALATTGIAMVVLARQRFWAGQPEQRRIPLPLLGVAFANGLMLLWTLLGLILGALFLAAEARLPADGIGSENRAFTLGVVAIAAGVLGLGAFVLGRLPWWAWASTGLAVVIFGWGLPNLAK